AVLALTLQRPRDLFADRCAVVGERHQARLVAVLLQPIAQQLGLRLLATLIETFERDEVSSHVTKKATAEIAAHAKKDLLGRVCALGGCFTSPMRADRRA